MLLWECNVGVRLTKLIMELSIIDDRLQIEFSLKEQLLAVRFHKIWQIPLTHIIQVTTDLPPK